jgi:hypothetical protein
VVFGKSLTDLFFGDGKVDFARMKRTIRGVIQAWALAVFCLLALLLALPSKAFGYVDPGTGSFLYQAIYAAVLGGIFYLRKFLNRFFKRDK